jgi:lipid-binding SYLF domain-containing protein
VTPLATPMEKKMRASITVPQLRENLLRPEHKARSKLWISLVLVAIGSLITSVSAQAGPLTPSASEIDQKSRTALRDLFRENNAARALAAQTKAILIFPDIKKGAFIVGAQYGYGALIEGTRTAGFYRTGAASYGFQAGVKKFGYALFFMTDSAVNYLATSGGWAIGTGPSLVVVDQGMARSLTTTNMRADVYAFVFNQKGLMGGIGLEGSKITKINPGQ